MKKEKKWYAIRVVSGKEKKCKEIIDKEIENNYKLNKNVFNVVVPMEKVFKIRNGKKYSIDRNFYPGYILIESTIDGEIVSNIESLSDVLNFLKDGRRPIPLRSHEVSRMLNKVDEVKEMTEYDIPFIVGENVQITDGPFKTFNGNILHINEDKKTVKLNVKIFERDTPLELGFDQIDKV